MKKKSILKLYNQSGKISMCSGGFMNHAYQAYEKKDKKKISNKKNEIYQIYKPVNKAVIFQDCSLLKEYLDYCHLNKMTMCFERKKFTTSFLQYLYFVLDFDLSQQSLSNLTLSTVKKYEEHLIKRVHNSEIKSNSAHVYLTHMKYFLKFLRNRGVIHFNYTTTRKIPQKPTKLNDYYSTEDLEILIHTMLHSESSFVLRNICLLMIMIETGCRPIELSNLLLSDIKFNERKITLTSTKSGVRTLSMDRNLIELLELYFQERTHSNITSEYLFCSKQMKKLRAIYISQIINHYSKKAFGRNFISPRGLRHTNATNLIETHNIAQVAEIMGHKHWNSTMLYISFAKERLISNTIDFNPLKGVINVDNQKEC